MSSMPARLPGRKQMALTLLGGAGAVLTATAGLMIWLGNSAWPKPRPPRRLQNTVFHRTMLAGIKQRAERIATSGGA